MIPCTHSFPALKNVPKRWTLLSLSHTRYPVWVRRRPTKWKWRPCPQVVPSQHWRSLCLCCRSAACHLYTYTLSCLSGVICTLIPNCLTALVVRHSTMAINLWAAGIMVPALGRSPWTPGWLYPWLQEAAKDFKNIPISLVSTTCKVKFDREETALGRELLPSSCSTVVIMFVPEWKLKSYSGSCASDLWDHLRQVKTQLIIWPWLPRPCM